MSRTGGRVLGLKAPYGYVVATLLALVVVVALAFWLGPREPVDTTRIRYLEISRPVDSWLAAEEANVEGLRSPARKRVVWAGEPQKRTPLALVYLHGFLASPEELQPVPENVASALGANLIYARLKGHGVVGDASSMSAATANDWLDDLAEALSVAHEIGDQTLIVGTSTGASLGALAAFSPEVAPGLAGIVLVSPNFRQRRGGADLLTLPFARTFVPWVMGEVRTWKPQSPAHGEAWSTTYSSVAVVPMAALAQAADRLPFEQATVPALFIFSDRDKVANEDRTAEVASRWGARHEVVEVNPAPTDDADAHVIAGDILSPSLTDEVTAAIVRWAQTLGSGSGR